MPVGAHHRTRSRREGKRHAFRAVISLVLATCLAAACGCDRDKSTSSGGGNQASIGVVLPLGTDTGDQARRGAEVAFELLAAGGNKLSPIWEDGKSDPATT